MSCILWKAALNTQPYKATGLEIEYRGKQDTFLWPFVLDVDENSKEQRISLAILIRLRAKYTIMDW
jgi:hypothetical protein